MKILKLSDLWQNFMKNDNIFDIICEEGSKNQIWWRGSIERFSDSAYTPHMQNEICLSPWMHASDMNKE